MKADLFICLVVGGSGGEGRRLEDLDLQPEVDYVLRVLGAALVAALVTQLSLHNTRHRTTANR